MPLYLNCSSVTETMACADAQAIKNQSLASHHSGKAGNIDRHEKLAERQGLSQLLSEWVADMKAAGLKHIGASLTALVQVPSCLSHCVGMQRALHALLVKPLVATQTAWLESRHRAVCMSRDGKHERQCRVITC